MTPLERELCIVTIERLVSHLKKQAAGPPGSSPFSPAEAYAFIKALRFIKRTFIPSEPPLTPDDDDDPPPNKTGHAP